jgi:MinD superfamily P-loop ATPase
MHPANRFTFHSWRKTARTAALGFGCALFAAVSTKNRALRLTELGKSGFHTLPRLHLTQDPLHLQLNFS